MEKYFVYYNDDYDAHEIEEFETEKDALFFIEDRMGSTENPKIENYVMYKGRRLELIEEEVVRKVRIKK